MIAIHTKFLPATSAKGERIKAYTNSSQFTATISYDYAMTNLGAHVAAVRELARKYNLPWDIDTMCYGDSSDGRGFTFCFAVSTISHI